MQSTSMARVSVPNAPRYGSLALYIKQKELELKNIEGKINEKRQAQKRVPHSLTALYSSKKSQILSLESQTYSLR
jgi:hypothetical protein